VIAVEAEQDAQAVLQELNAGADFAALARAKSRDPVTARLGGEAGWITRGTANPGIEAVAFSLKAGEVGLAKSEKASFVVKLEERRPERLQEFAAVKEKAREMLLTQRRREEVRRWLAQLRGASEIIVEDAAIGQAVAAFEDQAKQRAAGKSAKGEKKPKDHP
jgi:parvulin-like peptidyl-prolyl isomerase